MSKQWKSELVEYGVNPDKISDEYNQFEVLGLLKRGELVDSCFNKTPTGASDDEGTDNTQFDLWKCDKFEKINEALQQTDTSSIIDNDIEVEEGDWTCRNKMCRSRKCYSFQKQTRSADEGTTTFVVCVICKTQFKVG